MKKAEKILFVDNLTEELKSAKSFVLVNYSGLTVASQQELKKRLKTVGARLLVVKNTLLKRAGKEAKIDEKLLDEAILSGQTALIIGGEDPVSFIQILGKFAKEFVGKAGNPVPKLKVGFVEGSFQNGEELLKLSSLPGRDALLGQLLGTLMSPSYGLVGTLNGNLQKLIYVLGQKAKS